MINLGTLKEITDLRSIWPHEALNFTPWVAENVELLADAVGFDITVDETESSVGDFNVDIYASETGTDRKIIIENQLEDTDHDHLGKLITYASGKDADVVIWVVKHAREEHKAAVEWLNNHTDDKIGFFLCEIKLFQIGDSDIAPSFTVVERPNDWTKEIKKTTLTNPTQQQRLEYWNAFNDYALSFTELGYKKNGHVGVEGVPLLYFKDNKNRFATTNNGKFTVSWWLRSADSTYDSCVYAVGPEGEIGSTNAYDMNGIRPAFCVDGKQEIYKEEGRYILK